MILENIIKNCGVTGIAGDSRREISSICIDSRKATPGSMFIAVKGHGTDGHQFIASAIKAGAAAIMFEDRQALESQVNVNANTDVTLVEVKNSRHASALAAADFYGNPSRELTLVGITGTNGKTTTVTLLYNLFRGLGYKCGLLSTIANYVGDKCLETANTTADPLTINELMRQMVDEGCKFCFMEVSSIGMEQERVAGLKFKAGIFSNLTHDHLDYHKTFAEYLRCKKLFFDTLPSDAFAITNTCRIIEESFDGMQLRIDGKEIWTRLIGQHNAYNLLAIYTTAVIVGADPEEALIQLSRLESAKGRLETMRGPRKLSVIIDYAHTPDALENVLKTLRDIGPKQHIICLFGCGGDRDKTKRPEMAAVSEKYADRIFVTSDNSRTEKTEDILEDIRKGFSNKGLAKALFISDRKEAIRTAITLAPEGSVILLAGKGHETYQIIGTEHRHFDEREIVNEVFKSMEDAK